MRDDCCDGFDECGDRRPARGATGATGPAAVQTSAFAELAADVSINTAVFQPLLTVNLNVTTGQLEMLATASADITPGTGGALTFRLTVDGVPVPNGGASFEALSEVGTVIETIALLKRLIVANGIHTVVLEWATPVGTVATCKPASFPTFYHASLVARNV